MNYQRQELVDALASEYVLGTLRGRARRRFEALIRAYLPARRAVVWWEQRLAELALALKPVAPPAHLWARIEQRISPAPKGQAVGKSTRLWQTLAASFALISIGLISMLTLREPEVQVRTLEPAQVAIVADTTAPLWIVRAFPDLDQLRVRALRAITLEPTRSYELWMLPDAGTPPVSLGLMPVSGEASLPLDDAATRTLEASSTLAVSLEPAGGSPTGAPTGPVVYTAALVR
jgi:anti-sigma-K factor RskA